MVYHPYSRPQEPRQPGVPRGSLDWGRHNRRYGSGYSSTGSDNKAVKKLHATLIPKRNLTLKHADTHATEINYHYPTPAKIVEVWKAGDFFDIKDLVEETQKALGRRLKASAQFLRLNPEPKRKCRNNSHCNSITVAYGLCGHFVRENRVYPVHNAAPQTVFHLCKPERIAYREGMCGRCQMRWGNEGDSPWSKQPDRPEQDDAASSVRSPPEKAPVRPTPPDDETRGLIEDEIRALCDALVIATADTPQGSRMQKALISHMCNARVAAWDGFTVCRFLDW